MRLQGGAKLLVRWLWADENKMGNNQHAAGAAAALAAAARSSRNTADVIIAEGSWSYPSLPSCFAYGQIPANE